MNISARIRPRWWMAPAALSAGLLVARLGAAAPLSDPTGASLPQDLRLHVPLLNLSFSPLFDLWDGISMLSMSRLKALFVSLVAYYLLWRFLARRRRRWLHEAFLALELVLALLVFILIGALWHRPMIALVGVPEDRMVVDFHSHTNASHDVRGTLMNGFDGEAMRRWHRRAGFDLVFVTDHNTLEGFPAWQERRDAGRPYLCPGTEISAYRAHIVLLGNTRPVPREPYSQTYEGLLTLLRESESAYGALSIASLPEYARNHWKNLDDFVASGIDGFEVVNASPKPNDLSRARRDTVIALARRYDRLIVGVSDSHGWGATSMVWNLVKVPRWRAAGVDACAKLLAALREGGFDTVQVVERHRLRVDSWWPLWLTPVGVLWETWRGISWLQAATWIIWLWLGSVILTAVCSSRSVPPPAASPAERTPPSTPRPDPGR